MVPIVVRDNPYVHLELDKNLHITKFNETKNGSFSISKGNNDIGIFLIKSLEARKSISDLYDRLKNDISTREINFLSIFEKLTNLQIIASVLSDESLTLGANSTHELTKNWNEILSSHRIIK